MKPIRLLIVADVAANLIAVIALILALISISDIETSRVAGRHQSCELITAGLRQAAGPGRLGPVDSFISHHALSDCDAYARGPR